MNHPSEFEIKQMIKACIASSRFRQKVVFEMGIKQKTCRIDVAAISQRSLEGYEIKTHYDNLQRLPHQARHFSEVFHRMTLVAAPRHILDAVKLIPDWWGVVLVYGDQLCTLREPGFNTRINYRWFTRLLKIAELRAMCKQRGIAVPVARLNHAKLSEVLRANIPEDELCEAILLTMFSRAA
jgi:hypothetical protein